MKPYLVDVPVWVFVWIRPELQRRQFEVIKRSRPSTLFLISNGGRNPQEKELITISRSIVEDIDWECKVYKLYEEENIGLYGILKKGQEFVFSKVDRIIYFDDDVIPAETFIRFCAEMLEKYKHDERIAYITGTNYLCDYQAPESDYFFTHAGSIYGIAFWKRVYDQFGDSSYGDDAYTCEGVRTMSTLLPGFYTQFMEYPRKQTVNGHAPGIEYMLAEAVTAYHQLVIVSSKNMIKNMGAHEGGGIHTSNYRTLSKGNQQMFDAQMFELTFPLKHPKRIFPDYWHLKKTNRTIGVGHPLVKLYRRIIHWVKMICMGEGMILVRKLPEKLLRKERYEA